MTGVTSDPDATLRWAGEVLTSGTGDAVAMARAWHAAAVAHLELGRPVPARRAARRAVAVLGAEALLVLAWIEQDAGNAAASLRHLDEAQPSLRGELLARARCLRGLNLCVAGEHERASRELSAAVLGCRRHGDRRWLANALNGRGVVRAYLRRFAGADQDLATAGELYAALGEHERAATCLHNRGWVALRAGNVAESLRCYDAAVHNGLRTGARAEVLVDRADTLLAAGLAVEAAAVLGTAAELLANTGRTMRLAEAWLCLARCALRSGSRDLARRAANRAAELFRVQRRAGWLAAAESVLARLDGAAPAREIARRCARHGFLVDAAELWVAVGDPDLLRRTAAGRSRGPVRLRALGWLARARLAAGAGNRRGALAAAQAGLRLLNRQPQPDLAAELAAFGLRAALSDHDAANLLRWAEHGRCRVSDLAEPLGSQVMLRFVAEQGELAAVSIVDGRVRLHRLGRVPDGVESLRFAVGARAVRPAASVAGQLARMLLAPVEELIGDRALVVVPSAGLHGLPWAALPGCTGRAVSVASSCAGWLTAHRAAGPAGEPAWIAGPGLRHADREVSRLHARYGGTLLTSAESTADRVRQVLERADVVHIAAHGRYRPEAPEFSHLELARGALYAHDLVRPPALLVLSACDGALSGWLRPGTRAVLASTVPVADDAALALVTVLHANLRAGLGPARALAAAQLATGDRGFVCLGAG
ncbi:MAG: CHAT domain-containing protein [Labedaea sp.]